MGAIPAGSCRFRAQVVNTAKLAIGVWLVSAEIRPAATDEETAAIMGAMEALWPKPAVIVADEPTRRPTWRFSGRWWSLPLPVRRDRPYR